jgi:hypothetical protein
MPPASARYESVDLKVKSINIQIIATELSFFLCALGDRAGDEEVELLTPCLRKVESE